MKLYADANAIIFAHEAAADLRDKVVRRLVEIAEQPRGVIVTSNLSRLECGIIPLRMDDVELLREYAKFFASESVSLVQISDKTIDIATTLRVKYRFLKTPDAIHLATAIEQQADVFLTGDKALERCSELKVEII